MQATATSSQEALKEHFGYDSFLPHQEEIISDSLAGRDAFALLPTGGGKSICYQLPALLRPGVTIVVSPLIALMKDQVDALRAAGIAATFINSSLTFTEQHQRGRELLAGDHRLLYVAPERVMQESFLNFLRKLDVTLFAIDEAHCISEWGHDFRPEYRQLASLRPHFPKTPMMALTATATERVRKDILEQLGLQKPAVHIGSFNRRNLTYHVRPKKGAYEQLLAFVRQRPGESGIVYCHTRRQADSVAERLAGDRAKAKAYHAGMTPDERSRTQEAFSRDDLSIVCATVAFGMGINKSNVRFVFHYDMPKSMEGYHQETGRAGRDGLPAECVMLFSAGDAVRYGQFIDETEDEARREAGREQLRSMVEYARARVCRRRVLLAYFGEDYPQENCNACDNCLDPTPRFDATGQVRKFLACVFRIREKSGFNVGITHVAAVLAGSTSEKVRKFGHHEMSAFGAGKEHTQAQWADVGSQLVEIGLLHQNPARMNAAELTAQGMAALREHRQVSLAELRRDGAVTVRANLPACDDVLFERLRTLRKKLADERSVAAYMVFSDVALRQMARQYPADEQALRSISGVGASKLQEFGAPFMAEIADHVQTSGQQKFEDAAPAYAVGGDRLGESARESLGRYRLGHTVEAIAHARGYAIGTIFGHLAIAAEWGEPVDIDRLLTTEQQQQIAAAFATISWANVTGVRERLDGAYDYGLLKLYRAAKGPRATPPERIPTARAEENASPSATDGRTPASPSRSPASARAPASAPA